jgi:hypothetical protein
MFKKIIYLYFEKQMKFINTLFGLNTELLSTKASFTFTTELSLQRFNWEQYGPSLSCTEKLERINMWHVFRPDSHVLKATRPGPTQMGHLLATFYYFSTARGGSKNFIWNKKRITM